MYLFFIANPILFRGHMKGTYIMENIRLVGTVSRGIRCPIIREGDDLAKIVADSVLAAAENDGFSLRDRDVIALTDKYKASIRQNVSGT